MFEGMIGTNTALNRLTRFLTSHWDEQPRVEILGVLDEEASSVVRFRASRSTEYVRVHVQHDGAGGGGETFNASTYVSSSRYDCRLNRQMDVTVSKPTFDTYYVWLAPEYKDGDGTFARFTGEAGQGEDFMAFAKLGAGHVNLKDPAGDKWRLQITQYGGIQITNLDTAEVRTFYAIIEGATTPISVADETIYFQTPTVTPDTQSQVTSYVSSASATTISATSTYYKAAGTTTAVKTHENWSHSNNRWTYTGPNTVPVLVRATISSTCAGTNDEVRYRIVKNASPSATEAVASTQARYLASGSDVGTTPVEATFDVTTNDYVEVWVANETAADNVTLEFMHLLVEVNEI